MPARAARWPGAAIALRTARRAVRTGALWGYISGATVAASELTYRSTYKTVAERAHFAALFSNNAGLAAILGPAHELQSVAGFTAWKSFMFLAIVGAAWGLLMGTRLLRGEEEAGRWELLLAGQTTRRGAAAKALAGLGAGLAVFWALVSVIIIASGRSSKVGIAAAPSLYFALALVCPTALFAAVGSLAGQLAATRRQAASYAGAVLGVSYTLRMVADSGSGLTWLRWLTPLGWTEALQPLTNPRPLALLPTAACLVVLVGLTVYLAGNRDLGTSVLPDRASATAHTRLLGGPAGLAARLARGVVLGWAAAICAISLLMGAIAKQAGSAMAASPSFERTVARLGLRGGGAAQYLGFTFLTVAVMLVLIAAGQVSAARGEEAEGRLDHLLVRPVHRWSWLCGRVVLTSLALVACGLLAGLFAWWGAVADGAGLGLARLLGAGVNVVAPALCVLGIGSLVMGALPRAAVAVTYGLLAWSMLIELLGGFFSSNHWLLDTSVFHQMTPAPAVGPDWATVAVMALVGAAAAVLGALCFTRRDLIGE
jgi:ABC-2 type transport system permease protein